MKENTIKELVERENNDVLTKEQLQNLDLSWVLEENEELTSEQFNFIYKLLNTLYNSQFKKAVEYYETEESENFNERVALYIARRCDFVRKEKRK